jgi:ADP-ribosylglycohydrolase/fructose-1,6-bisphosphatase/inositol monophosphatase family enzyme
MEFNMYNLPDESEAILNAAVEAAKAAGDILREEFNRPGGPRGVKEVNKAEADEAAEQLIYNRLSEAYPQYGFVGEETDNDREPSDPDDRLWVVDPNDGTGAYMRGFRGAAVSIALFEGGEPVLGVVYAFNYPDDNGDLIAWVNGGPVFRNGKPGTRMWPDNASADCTVLISQSADKNPVANARCVSPMRYRAMPSIAYRLALAAVGEGDVAVSLNSPTNWDLAGGHAILIGAGADLYNADGEPIRYSVKGHCNYSRWVFGGPKVLVDHIRTQGWQKVFDRPVKDKRFALCWPKSGGQAIDADMLSRAQGCLLGQMAGDALGSLAEFQTPEQIRQEYPDGVRRLIDGGAFNTIAGQPTDDTEMALMLARSLIQEGTYNSDSALPAYKYWLDSNPFDIGGTILGALSGRLNYESQANGALMRISPLGIFGAKHSLNQIADWAQQDAALTHPHPVCKQINALFAMAISHAIKTGESPHALYQNILKWARDMQVDPSILTVIQSASDSPPEDYMHHQGWVLIAFHNALYQLLHAENLENGIVDTVMRGGDTDTNAAICGALLGAVHGRDAIPQQWLQSVLTCRPMAGQPGIHRPRPESFWPVDAMVLVERLLGSGS